MKLIVQIPCLNEEATIGLTIKDIPRTIEGINKVEILVIDDGSTDNTLEEAEKAEADHIISLGKNMGLAKAFAIGLENSIKLGADIVVNIDGDNQYNAADIPKLIKPILEGTADIVIGERPINTIAHFSFLKKRLQHIGSWAVRKLSGTDIRDVTSGFRAFSREATLRLNVLSDFSYTLETVIQAGLNNLKIDSVKIRVNEKLRESRLYQNLIFYLRESTVTIFRIYLLYRPLKTFSWISGILFLMGFLLGIRFLYFYFTTSGSTGHMQSLILMAVLLILSSIIFTIGLVADLISSNRRLIEEGLYKIRRFVNKK